MENIYNKTIDILENMGISIDLSEEDIVLQEYIVDSIQFISLIVSIEETFNISFPDEYLTYESISSFSVLCQIIYDIIYDS